MSSTKLVASSSVNFRSTRYKVPVYTSDKRAKFTQRVNKKWIRLVTVIGYLVSVAFPAVILSIYYLFFWDPDYGNRFSPNFTAMGDSVFARIEEMRSHSPGLDSASANVQCAPCVCPAGDRAKRHLLDLLTNTHRSS